MAVSDRQLADDLTLRGIAVDGVFDLGEHGSLLEMDITTNRVDAMNHYGIAREAATIYGLQLQPLQFDLPAAQAAEKPFPVRIEEPTLCGRFTARVLRGVTIRPSHGVIAERFALLDQKPISNAVDATNFVTLALGHPTHAFDLDKLEGGTLVRRARKGDKLVTPDGIERTLDTDDLVGADEKKAVGLAGVMGGLDTAISATTKNVLVEAAWFDPATVRRSSRRHAIHTDASHRFERGADFNAAPIANALVSRIILETGGHIEGDLVDVLIPEAETRTARRPAGPAPGARPPRRVAGPPHRRRARGSGRRGRRSRRTGPPRRRPAGGGLLSDNRRPIVPRLRVPALQLQLGYDPDPPFGGIDYDNIGGQLGAWRATVSLAAPVIAAKPKRLTSQGR